MKHLKMHTEKIPEEPDLIEIRIDKLVNWVLLGFYL